MTSFHVYGASPVPNPLDSAETVMLMRDWTHDRPCEEELVAEISGTWWHYDIWVAWQEQLSTLVLTCALDTKLPKSQRGAIYPLLAMVNEKMWLGHFDLCGEDGAIMFRYSLPLRGSHGITDAQMEDLLDIAFNECERFYPAFQSVAWGGKSAEDALAAAMFETHGVA